MNKTILVIYDDRERVSSNIENFVGIRSYGEIQYKKLKISEIFRANVPHDLVENFIVIKNNDDLHFLRKRIENSENLISACVISSRAAFVDFTLLQPLLERVRFSEDSFANRSYSPTLVFFHNAHNLVDSWELFKASPISLWESSWHSYLKLAPDDLLDLSDTQDFLKFITASTDPRFFNRLHFEPYSVSKSSIDKNKILAEYSYYQLVPEEMKPWLVESYGFVDNGDRSCYSTARYNVPDVATQWVHNSFSHSSFDLFLSKILYFLNARPTRTVSKELCAEIAHDVFIRKTSERIESFLKTEYGNQLNLLLSSFHAQYSLREQLKELKITFELLRSSFVFSDFVIGHGDPCFSNILYDKSSQFLKLLDPRGALNQEQLWTHPLYDYAKVGQCILGDYDYINSEMFNLEINGLDSMKIEISGYDHQPFKSKFCDILVSKFGHQFLIITKLAIASLFLSMLPFHADSPKKLIAFSLKSREFLDEFK